VVEHLPNKHKALQTPVLPKRNEYIHTYNKINKSFSLFSSSGDDSSEEEGEVDSEVEFPRRQR
jgi:hypothetical protein